LTAATHRLAAGDYAARVDSQSHDELGGLARDFNGLAQALGRNEQSRREFMADISHELRTPLAVMRAELEAMEDGIRPIGPAPLLTISDQVRQLSKLVNDLHDLSLTDVGALAYRRSALDLSVVLKATVESMRSRFSVAQLELNAQLPAAAFHVQGDERRLQQLFSNLLENSLRYTDAGGKVEVGCERNGRLLRITVDDSAPAVEPDKLPRLFERFYRAEASRNRASGGSGLGLAICRNIVQAHDGSIEASLSSLGGLRIIIELPVEA
jgi:two-component system sensor histidine kinase BaeS